MQKWTHRNAILNKIFHDEYFYDIVWRDYWPAAEPLADARGTLGFRGTPVEKHCPKLIVSYLYSPDGATISLWQRHIGWMSQIFPIPLSFSTLVQGDPLWIYEKPLRFLKLVFQAADGEDLVILACTAFDWSTSVTDRKTNEWTDGQTDRIAMAKTRYSSSCCCT